MGVNGLLPRAEQAFATVTRLSELADWMVLTLDTSAFIHPILRRHAGSIILDGNWSPFAEECRELFAAIRNTVPSRKVIVVFDGLRVQGKLANQSRSAARLAAMARVDEALERGHRPSKKDLAAGVGAESIEAGVVLWRVLKAEDIGIGLYAGRVET